MLTIGIVGAGLRGRLFAAALATRSDVRVVAFAEPSQRVAAAATEATGIDVVASHIDLLERYSPDAVIVATPDFAHRQVAVDVALTGTHLLIEKPLATTLEDAEAIAAAVREGGGRCLVGFENRWNPHVVAALHAVESGDLGDHVTSSATLSNSYFVPTEMLSWAALSSPAWFLMPHSLDLILALSGRVPVSVTAAGSRGILTARGVDTWDVVHALITFDDGTTASLSSTWVLPDARDGIVDFQFASIGTKGSVTADLGHQGLTLVTDKQRATWPLGSSVGHNPSGPAAWMVLDFATNLISGEPLGPDVEHGLLVTKTICAMEESLRTGRSVVLDELVAAQAE